MSSDHLHAFLATIAGALGSAPDAAKVVAGGPFVRFSTNGKRGDDSGWCRFFADARGGVYGCHRAGVEFVWQVSDDLVLSGIDRRLRAREIARARADREAEESTRLDRGAQKAADLWTASPLVIRHPYTDRKQIDTGGLRCCIADGRSSQFFVTSSDGLSERLRGPLILVPMCNANRRLLSLQAIDSAGRKSFMRGGVTVGTYYVIGRNLLRGLSCASYAGEVCIAEGLATGAAVHALSGAPTFVAFSASNLERVARAARSHLPKARIVVTGDVDRSGVGQRAAQAAAAAVGGDVSLPSFTPAELAAGSTDWADWRLAHVPTVQRQVAG